MERTRGEAFPALDESGSLQASDIGPILAGRSLPFLKQFRTIVEADDSVEDGSAQQVGFDTAVLNSRIFRLVSKSRILIFPPPSFICYLQPFRESDARLRVAF